MVHRHGLHGWNARSETAGDRARRLPTGRAFRERPDLLQRQAARSRPDGAGSRPRDRCLAADARFRGHARAVAPAQSRARPPQARPDARTRHLAPLRLFQRLGRGDRRSRPRRRRPARTRGGSSAARLPHRLRSARLGPARARLDAGLGHRAALGRGEPRDRPRFLPHLRARQRDRAAGGLAERTYRARAGRRRTAHRDGPDGAVAASPLLPGTGRPPRRRLSRCRSRDRIRRPDFARDLQRPVPRCRAGCHRARWHALPADGAGRSRLASARRWPRRGGHRPRAAARTRHRGHRLY